MSEPDEGGVGAIVAMETVRWIMGLIGNKVESCPLHGSSHVVSILDYLLVAGNKQLSVLLWFSEQCGPSGGSEIGGAARCGSC